MMGQNYFNMSEILRRFNGDKETKRMLQEYVNDYISKAGVYKMLNRQDVSGIADAFELINKSFDQLDIDFDVPQETYEQINPAR